MKVIVDNEEEKKDLQIRSIIFRELDDKYWVIEKSLTQEELRHKKIMDKYHARVDAIENNRCEDYSLL